MGTKEVDHVGASLQKNTVGVYFDTEDQGPFRSSRGSKGQSISHGF